MDLLSPDIMLFITAATKTKIILSEPLYNSFTTLQLQNTFSNITITAVILKTALPQPQYNTFNNITAIVVILITTLHPIVLHR